MGSGLIWAGIGKGISDAGATYGNMMFKAAESELSEQRALQRAEALERLKEQMLEERSQKDAAKAIEIDQRATKIGEERATKQLDKDVKGLINAQSQIAGDAPAVSEEELRKLMEENPQYREIYRQAGYIDKAPTRNQQRFQAADDSVQAARELGASSTLLKSYQDVRKAVLDEIKEENRDRRAAEAEEGRDRRAQAAEERRSREFQALLPVRQQQADASTTRAGAAVTAANRPRGGSGSDSGEKPITGVDLERAAKAAEKALALELGVPVKDLQSEVARLKKRNQLTAEAQAKLDDYNSSLTRWQNYKSDTKSPKGGDNTGTRPPLSSFVQR